MESRAALPVALPHSSPTISYWQDPPSSLATHRTTPSLPSHADYIIIGSGISGASIATKLLLKAPHSSIAMLEARTACSGATGRNGGHTKASSYRAFCGNVQKLGKREALKIARLMKANVDETHAFAVEHGIDCDSHPCNTVDVIFDEAQFEAAKRGVEMLERVAREEGVGIGRKGGVQAHEIMQKKEASERYHCPEAVGAIEFAAGSISGYKFVIGMLELALAKGLNLQTDTPATKLEEVALNERKDKNVRWRVHTPRGVITAYSVILATNGYTAHLYAPFHRTIVPLRGQITAQRPGLSLPALSTTYSFIYTGGNYEYMISRPPGTKFAGDIVIGGGWGQLPDAGTQEFGIVDDSEVNEEVGGFLRESTVKYFGQENWGKDHADGRVRKEWTGIMGTSADGKPYVGIVPGQEGLWISASFDGSGMVLCVKCAEALTTMLIDCAPSSPTAGEAEAALDEWFPRSYRLTEKRFHVPFQGRLHAKVDIAKANGTNGHA